MKLFCSIKKYVFEMAGFGSICPDGYRTPYHVYKRIFPFVYSYLGTCWLAHWDKEENIREWIDGKEEERRKA